MPITLLLAPPAGGKTTACLERIHQVRSRDPLAPIHVIVPDALQTSGWKKSLATAPNGAIGVTVTTFRKFAQTQLEAFHDRRLILPDHLNALCISIAIERTAALAPLEHFAPIQTTPGLLEELEKTFARLQRALISPEQFAAHADSAKLRDVAHIFQAYRANLDGKDWVAEADRIRILIDHFYAHPQQIPAFPLLIVDGFDEFDNDEIELLRLLAMRTDDLVITLPGVENDTRFTYRKFISTARKLKHALNPQIQTLAASTNLPPAIAHMLTQVFTQEPRIYTGQTDDTLQFIETSSQEDEVRETLRRIKHRVLIDGLRPIDCAIFVADPQTYFPILRSVGAEMGVPLTFSIPPTLTNEPIVATLKMLFSLATDNFSTPRLLSLLRTPFFDFGFSAQDIAALDTISQNFLIIGGRDQWQMAFDALSARPLSERIVEQQALTDNDFDEDEGAFSGTLQALDPISLGERLREMFGTLTPPTGALSKREWTEWLIAVLNKVSFFDRLHKTEQEMGRIVRTTLEQLILFEKMLAQKPVTYAQFINPFFSALESQTVPSDPGNTQNSVYVGQIAEARSKRYASVSLIGFSEKLFPRPVHDELILTTSLREKLGIPLERNQSSLMIQAISRADRFLLITRPRLTDTGDEWQPSIFWTALTQTLPPAVITRIGSDEGHPLSESASFSEQVFRLAQQKIDATSINDPDASAILTAVIKRQSRNRLALARFNDRLTGNHPGNATVPLRDPSVTSDPDKRYSASQIETYLICPFAYFIRNQLKLEPPVVPAPGMDAAQRGSLLHRILEDTFRNAPNPDDRSAVDSAAERACEDILAHAPDLFGFRPSHLWEYEKEEIRRQICDTITNMYEGKKALFTGPGWKVIGTEVKFGYGDTPPLEIPLDNGRFIRLRGSIDRVDRDPFGKVRIVDYKTSGSHLSSADMKSGRRIQAGLYAMAAVEALRLSTHSDSIYWIIRTGESAESASYDLAEEENVLIPFVQAFADGVRAGDYPAAPLGGKCPRYCAAAAWCPKFEPEY